MLVYADDTTLCCNINRNRTAEVIKGECNVFKKKLLWMKTRHYLNTIRSHLVTIVPMAPFTPNSTSKLRSALHIISIDIR